MLTLSEAFHWVQVGFCIAVGLGLARLIWTVLCYVWSELNEERKIENYTKQFRRKGKPTAKP